VRARKAAVALTAGIVLLGADAANAVTTADRHCRSAVQENSARLARTVMKAMDSCLVREQLSTSPSTDCNSLGAADARGKITKATVRTTTAILEECSVLPPSYPNCPSPADDGDAGGATSGVDDIAELADCQVAINTETIVSLRNYILRPRASAILAHPRARDLKKCAKAIAKGATKLWYTAATELANCQQPNQGPNDPYAYVCSGYSNLDLEETEAKVRTRIGKSCSDLTADQMALLGACSADWQDAQDCVVAAVKKSAGGATATAYEFAGVCPAQMEVVLNAGGRQGERNSSTSVDLGWSGLGHGADLFDRFTSRVDLACAGDDCASCALAPSCDGGNCRCAHDPSIECTTPFVGGPPCGFSYCAFYLGPPLPLSAGGGAICVMNAVSTPLAGVIDVGTGESSIAIDTVAKGYAGISQPQPCPVCVGDTLFDDGARDGTCQGGARNGLACDADAESTSYGATSYDCPPTAVSNITGAGLKIPLDLTSESATLPFALPCDPPLAALDCVCSVCTLDNSRSCNSDAECATAGAGTCRTDGLHGGAPRMPNGCDGQACSADPDPSATPGAGVCAVGPTDTFCDGITTSDGEGYIPCSVHADCSAIVPPAGNCLLQERRRCFSDPIVATGVAGTEGAELVATFCAAPTSSGQRNAAFGLPGPGRVRLDVNLTAYCPAPNETTEFELGGSSCN
jgi:hypothetical protein